MGMSELKLPSLGEGIEKGTVISIAVKVGDAIVLEQPILEVETDKVVVEVPADAAGVVTDILVVIGDEITEGTPIIAIRPEEIEEPIALEVSGMEKEQQANALLEPATAITALKTSAPPVKQKTKKQLRQLHLPSLGEGIEKGTVITIMVAEGDEIAVEQALLEVETDKVVVEVPADAAGIIDKILLTVGDEVGEGHPMLVIQEDSIEETNTVPTTTSENTKPEAEVRTAEKKNEKKEAEKKPEDSGFKTGSKTKKGFRASPLAKKLAREIGINLAEIPLSETGKRIAVKDVKAYAKQLNQNPGSHAQLANTPLPDLSRWGQVRRETMTGIMQATSKNMTTSWSQIPHAWLQEKVDICFQQDPL